MKRFLIPVGIITIALASWFVWLGLPANGHGSPDAMTAKDDSTTTVQGRSSSSKDAVNAQRSQPRGEGSVFRLASPDDHRDEDPIVTKARTTAFLSWVSFVRRARPDERQQQAILAALHDGELAYQAAERVVDGYLAEVVAEGPSDTRPGVDGVYVSTTQEVYNDVHARARAVLSAEQYRAFDAEFGGAIDLAVSSKLVATVP